MYCRYCILLIRLIASSACFTSMLAADPTAVPASRAACCRAHLRRSVSGLESTALHWTRLLSSASGEGRQRLLSGAKLVLVLVLVTAARCCAYFAQRNADSIELYPDRLSPAASTAPRCPVLRRIAVPVQRDAQAIVGVQRRAGRFHLVFQMVRAVEPWPWKSLKRVPTRQGRRVSPWSNVKRSLTEISTALVRGVTPALNC